MLSPSKGNVHKRLHKARVEKDESGSPELRAQDVKIHLSSNALASLARLQEKLREVPDFDDTVLEDLDKLASGHPVRVSFLVRFLPVLASECALASQQNHNYGILSAMTEVSSA